MNFQAEFGVGNLPRLTIPIKETYVKDKPEPKANGKVFRFCASSTKFKRRRLNSDVDLSTNQVKSQSIKIKSRTTLYNYFSKPNSAGLT